MTLIAKTEHFTFAGPPDKLILESGEKLGPVTVAYETYGRLNEDKSNAVLICHALSGDAHAAGKHKGSDEKAGWWDNMIGPKKAFDTEKYFVICSNIIGGCMGSTGPSSINPETGKPYALDFPVITIADMVKAQKALIDYLGVDRLLAVSGGSMGGMQALQWAVQYPDSVRSVIAIATTSKLSPQSIAFDEVGRRAVMADPDWNNGNYYGKQIPKKGLALARMIGHITYLSDQAMHTKFGRDLKGAEKFDSKFDILFQVENYLHHQGDTFTQRFDANSYLYITKAMDFFDLSEGYKSLAESFKRAKSRFLVISFSSDWLFPRYQSLEIVRALKDNGLHVSYRDVESPYGHDAFLLEVEELTGIIAKYLEHLRGKK